MFTITRAQKGTKQKKTHTDKYLFDGIIRVNPFYPCLSVVIFLLLYLDIALKPADLLV